MKILKEIIKIIITIFLFFLIFKKIPIGDVKLNLISSNKLYLLFVFLSFFLYYFFFSLRWCYLLNSAGIKISKGRSYVIIIISFFFNNFLPSAVGQDFVRSAYVSKIEFSRALGVSLIDRFLGFIGMLILGIFAAFNITFKIRVISIFYLFLILSLFLIFFILTNIKIGIGIKNKILGIKFLNLSDEMKKFYNVLKDYKDKKIIMLNGIILSIIIQIIITIINFFICKSLGIDISFYNLIVLLPIITIFSLVPLTLNGLGLREFAYIYFFGLAGISGKDSLSISLIFFVISVFASLIGGIFFLFLKRES